MNTTICPTCGHSNNCAVANKHNPKQCWCMQETIDQQLLKQLAEQYQQSANSV